MSRTDETVNRVSRVHHNHNKDVHDTHETVKCMSASVGVTVESRESLTIMCDANGMCGNAEISTQSQFGRL